MDTVNETKLHLACTQPNIIIFSSLNQAAKKAQTFWTMQDKWICFVLVVKANFVTKAPILLEGNALRFYELLVEW